MALVPEGADLPRKSRSWAPSPLVVREAGNLGPQHWKQLFYLRSLWNLLLRVIYISPGHLAEHPLRPAKRM